MTGSLLGSLTHSPAAFYISEESKDYCPCDVGILQNTIVLHSHLFFTNDFSQRLDGGIAVLPGDLGHSTFPVGGLYN